MDIVKHFALSMPQENKEMSQQYLKICEKHHNRLEATFKENSITIFRENDDRDWYIIVVTKFGGYLVDGWWNNSFTQNIYDALDYALEEAMLI